MLISLRLQESRYIHTRMVLGTNAGSSPRSDSEIRRKSQEFRFSLQRKQSVIPTQPEWVQ